jgi:hypothetical protein
MQPESSDGFASVGAILPEEGAALLPGGSFRFCGIFRYFSLPALLQTATSGCPTLAAYLLLRLGWDARPSFLQPECEALYQGTTLVVPQEQEKSAGFSPGREVPANWAVPRFTLPRHKGTISKEQADVAQLVEQLIRNQQVTGSIPVVGSIPSRRSSPHLTASKLPTLCPPLPSTQ